MQGDLVLLFLSGLGWRGAGVEAQTLEVGVTDSPGGTERRHRGRSRRSAGIHVPLGMSQRHGASAGGRVRL